MLRDRVPYRYRRNLAHRRVRLRRPTARLRPLPDFVIIGAQRAGTSSLYRYLAAHPHLRMPLRKEISYFTRYWGEPLDWYRAHFPITRAGRQAFEASPQYLSHPLAPARFASVLPDARVVVAVRDPVERALSHHRHTVELGNEDLDIDDALDAEAGRVEADLAALDANPAHLPRALFKQGYVTRSRYGEQLERWCAHIERSRLHIFWFDEFLEDPAPEWDRLVAFLGLPAWRPPAFANWSSQTAPVPVDARVRARIRAALEPDRPRFTELAGRTPPW